MTTVPRDGWSADGRSGRLVAVLVLAVGCTSIVSAQGPSTGPDLGRATLDELMKMQITSAGRKTQRVDDTPAAVSVITSDDIRRSGMRTLPDLLRLVPGVQVGQINSSHWAVSIRGFNDQFSNKLLVLIDGRSIYKPNTSGVFWDAEDLLLDDIDRIEVIRGPGGAVWGANAVNGVINIVTRTARETQGAFVRLRFGTSDPLQGVARYGGTIGRSAAYRLYSQWTDRGDTTLPNLTSADDHWTSLASGGRIDWTRGSDRGTFDAGVRTGETRPLWRTRPTLTDSVRTDVEGWYHSGTAVGRWTHDRHGGSTLQVQSAATLSRRSDIVHESENTFEADLQYHTRVARRHDVVAGGGYRFADNTTGQSFPLSLEPPDSRQTVSEVFVQDEVTLAGHAWLTLGSKLEHHTVASWGVQPTARFLWQPAAAHRVWGAASRAIRTPSNIERAGRLNVAVIPGDRLPVVIASLGNPDFKAEQVIDVEGGYRFELGSRMSFDATTFRAHYVRLRTLEPQPPLVETAPAPAHVLVASRFDNNLEADTTGVEIAAHMAPARAWRVDGSYAGFRLTPHPSSASLDAAAATYDGNAPSHQWQLHSVVWIGGRTEVDAGLYGVGRLRELGIPAYTRADVRLELRLTKQLAVAVAGRNLLDRQHPEYGGPASPVIPTLVPRDAYVRLIWRFRQ